MLEQLRIVLEAEAEARQRLEAARETAKTLVSDAENDGRQRVQQARAAREAVVRSVEDQWVQQARQKAAAAEDEVRVRVQALRARAEPRVERAVETLVRRVLGREGGDGR
jgi:vacuolar-type H+-ATPase subunit H